MAPELKMQTAVRWELDDRVVSPPLLTYVSEEMQNNTNSHSPTDMETFTLLCTATHYYHSYLLYQYTIKMTASVV
jgi:hypothetical protein